MEQLKEYLDILLSSQESTELEFKHAHGGFPGNFWETYSAFANTNGGLIVFVDAHRTDITRMLRGLCNDEYLIAEGIGRGTHYKLAAGLSHNNTNDKVKDKAKDKVKDKAKDKVVRNKESAIEELKAYCTVWRKSSDMARHVSKTPKYISRSIIPEMLERGLLIREFPDIPTHPAQRYRIKPK